MINKKDKLVRLISEDNQILEISDIRALVENIGDLSNIITSPSGELPIISLLVMAVKKCKPEIVEYLIDNGAEINHIRKYYIEPVEQAVTDGRIDMLDLLIKKKAKLNFTSNLGRSVIQRAVARSNYEMVSTLIKEGVDINIQDINGDSALHLASRSPDPEMVELLMDAGIDKDLVNIRSKTALTKLLELKEIRTSDIEQINQSINIINLREINQNKASMSVFCAKKNAIKRACKGKKIAVAGLKI